MADQNTIVSGQGGPASEGAGQSNWRQRLPFYYGWLIVASCFVILGIILTVWYSFSVFYVSLLEEFHWTRAASAGVFSLFVVVNGFAGVAAGTVADRFGPGRVIAVGAALMAGALLACSTISSLPQFYLYFGVLAAIGNGAAAWVPSMTMINRWFYYKLGTAIGLATAGVGVGILIMVPVTQMLINQMGWRNAYLILAAIVFFGVVPIALLFIQGKPEDYGLKRDGRPMQATAGDPAAAMRSRIVDHRWCETDWTPRKAFSTRRYWLLFLMMALANVSTQMILVHDVAFMVDGGNDKMMAASVAGLIGLFSVPAKISWGRISDRIGRELTWTLGLGCTLTAILILIASRFVPFTPLLYLFSLVFAFGYGATVPLTPVISADLFSGHNYGSIYGTLTIANGIGSASGSWIAGYVFDLTGNYFWAFGTGGACALLSVAIVWLIAPGQVRRVTGKRQNS